MLETIQSNTGWTGELPAGDFIKVEGVTTADFVAFNADDFTESFNQGRTKFVNGNIFASEGTILVSKFNNVLLEIVEDTFDKGTHDMQKDMCSTSSHETWGDRLFEVYENFDIEGRATDSRDLPDHGCLENLSAALEPYGIERHEVPSPVNFFQPMAIDGETGNMEFIDVMPDPGTYVILEARMDCLIGISACPEGGRGRDIQVETASTKAELV